MCGSLKNCARLWQIGFTTVGDKEPKSSWHIVHLTYDLAFFLNLMHTLQVRPSFTTYISLGYQRKSTWTWPEASLRLAITCKQRKSTLVNKDCQVELRAPEIRRHSQSSPCTLPGNKSLPLDTDQRTANIQPLFSSRIFRCNLLGSQRDKGP